MFTNNIMDRGDLLTQISTEKAFLNFIVKMSKNEQFAKDKPNTHGFFVSIANGYARYGKLTDRQKVAIDREIKKYAQYFVSILNPQVVIQHHDIDKPLPWEVEQAEAERHAMNDAQ